MGRGRSKAGVNSNQSGQMLSNVPMNAQAFTDSDAASLRQQQDSMYDANTTAAVKMYISNTDFDNQGHSLSQTMNYLLDNGEDLNSIKDINAINKKYGLNLTLNDLASMQYTDSYMAVATHSIGKSAILQRGAHDDMLKNAFGISDYTKMSEKQLQQTLVGKTFKTKSYMSTSYDVKKNPFLGSGQMQAGGREVVYNVKTGPNTKILFGARKQSEIVIDKSTDFKITGVKYTGKIATPRGGRLKPQIVIDIETY